MTTWSQHWKEFRDSLGSVISFPADYFAGWFGVAPSDSGVEVNELTAVQIAAFTGCTRLLSDVLSSTPLNVWERNSDGTESIALEHSLSSILRLSPNNECTAADMFHAGMTHICLTGNMYLEKGYNGAGQVGGLFLRNPFRTIPYRFAKGGPGGYGLEPGDLFYKTNDTPTGYERIIRAEDVIHVKGLGMDGLVGLSPVKYYAREVLGTDLAAQSYAAKFFANDSRPGGYLKTPGMRDPEQKLKDAQTWIAAHARGNARRVAILDGGMEWVNVGIPPEEAQFLQTREFNRTQIACIFGIPPHFLGEAAESRANMEQRALEFLTFTAKPWFNRFEQAFNFRLFPSVGRNAGRFFCRFDTSQFERATYADLLKGVQMGRYAGLLTGNEGRKLLGFQPYSKKQLTSKDPADKLWQPVNMVWVTTDWDKEKSEPAGAGDGGQGGNDQDGGDGSGTPASGTTQGGKRDREIGRYFAIFYATFRDAVGRILARSKPDKADFERCFSPILTTAACAFECDPAQREPGDMSLSERSAAFVREYIAGIAHRATASSNPWKTSSDDRVTTVRADQIAADELSRALKVLRDKCASEASGPHDEEDDEDEIPALAGNRRK
jgi:HK97 family phage portal protein